MCWTEIIDTVVGDTTSSMTPLMSPTSSPLRMLVPKTCTLRLLIVSSAWLGCFRGDVSDTPSSASAERVISLTLSLRRTQHVRTWLSIFSRAFSVKHDRIGKELASIFYHATHLLRTPGPLASLVFEIHHACSLVRKRLVLAEIVGVHASVTVRKAEHPRMHLS